jgi:hypothetical protein
MAFRWCVRTLLNVLFASFSESSSHKCSPDLSSGQRSLGFFVLFRAVLFHSSQLFMQTSDTRHEPALRGFFICSRTHKKTNEAKRNWIKCLRMSFCAIKIMEQTVRIRFNSTSSDCWRQQQEERK